MAELLDQGLGRKPFLGGFTFGEQGPTVPGDAGLNAHCNLMFNTCLFGPRKVAVASPSASDMGYTMSTASSLLASLS